MTAPQITPLPPAPQRNDAPADFSTKADAHVAALPLWTDQANTIAVFVDARASEALSSSQEASSSAASATSSKDSAENSAISASESASIATDKASEAYSSANSAHISAQDAESSAQRAALDAQAVADALSSIAGGPVASVAGKTGVVTLDQLSDAGVATQSGDEILENKTLQGLKGVSLILGSSSNIDLDAANVLQKTVSAATSFSVSGAPGADRFASFILELTNGGAHTITWFPGVKWSAGVAPGLTASGVDILGFYSRDGGSTWRGLILSRDSK
jgi:hypothetical protein